ncbi:hypothetical protein Poly30_28650 [Planctomycetes bacterium Poly30]|uniref:Uncharacterized protein n=1 Tax=Saltatorellus ferox TaxID=2528018 RepID=A0A518ETC2_9BACT|nr:hypothetical protein Poly30_28650 [Planctomycetes bacterium Poly30]
MTPPYCESPLRSASIGLNDFTHSIEKVAALGAREEASGRLLRSLCELVDSHPSAAIRYIDVGQRRSEVREGVRVSTVPMERVHEVERAVGTIARAFCALEMSPRAFVLSSASLFSLGQRDEAESTACKGLRLFGIQAEGALLALTAAMAARMRGDWETARSHYLSMHDCRIDSYRRIAFAAASIAAAERDDLSAASHFYVALMALGVETGHRMIRQVATIRLERGDGECIERALAQLLHYSWIKPLRPNA